MIACVFPRGAKRWSRLARPAAAWPPSYSCEPCPRSLGSDAPGGAQRRTRIDAICPERPHLSWPSRLTSAVVWGSNTGVGKTLVSAGLARVARQAERPLLYIKPAQTGFPADSDARLVGSVADVAVEHGEHAAYLERGGRPGHAGDDPSACVTLFAWAGAVSPHLAVEREGRPAHDHHILAAVAERVEQFTTHASRRGLDPRSCFALLETAGGVCSPAPSGTLQCDLLRPWRLPALLVCDGRLGSVSACLTALDSLELRGYDIPAVVVLEAHQSQHSLHNARAIEAALRSRLPGGSRARHQRQQDEARGRVRLGPGRFTRVFTAPPAPPPDDVPDTDGHGRKHGHDHGRGLDLRKGHRRIHPATHSDRVEGWLHDASHSLNEVLAHLDAYHAAQAEDEVALPAAASRVLWWPFTQHGTVPEGGVTSVDSRWGDRLTLLPTAAGPAAMGSDGGAGDALQSAWAKRAEAYDACCSWWTQGLGEKHHAGAARALAYAAGRWGHVLLPQMAHGAAVGAATALLDAVNGPDRASAWGHRVFWSDDGSTAAEVALKMAFRTFEARRGGVAGPHAPLHVLALAGGYHGDTLGAMDAAAPSPFNARQTPWYDPRGLFLPPPVLAVRGGAWRVRLPPSLARRCAEDGAGDALQFLTAEAAMCPLRRQSRLAGAYRAHVAASMDAHEASTGARIGAMVVEPLMLGAGGMVLCDPLFQWAMAEECRSRGVPVVADEVFSGLFRLGTATASSQAGIVADIACFGKLLTAGTVPLAATVASEEVFRAFEGPNKVDALLHGHSYAGNPVGCHAALTALTTLCDAGTNPNLLPGTLGECARLSDGGHPDVRVSEGCVAGRDVCSCAAGGRLRELWSAEGVAATSRLPGVESVTALGTVMAVELGGGGAGYTASTAGEVVAALRERGVFTRPLGNVVYIMVSPTTPVEEVRELQQTLQDVLSRRAQGLAPGSGASADSLRLS